MDVNKFYAVEEGTACSVGSTNDDIDPCNVQVSLHGSINKTY